MSRWGAAFRIVVAAVVSFYSQNWSYLASQIAQEEARRKRNSMIDQAARDFNDAQKDRLQMLDMSANAPRTLVLGRVRAVEGIRRRWVSGTHSENLTIIVSFAGHEIDAFEQWYVDDTPVTLDGSGWVNEAPWRVAENVPGQSSEGALDGSGGAVVVLSSTPVGGSVTAVTWSGTGDNYTSAALTVVSVVGSTVTLSGGLPSGPYRISYTAAQDRKYLRIRPHLGADSQNLGPALAAEYPGKIESTAAFAGIAVAIVDLIYSPDVYPMGPPQITAVMRGAKCYDPRLDSTVPGGSGAHRDNDPTTWAWTENPALLIGRYARWRSGLNLAAYSVRSADQIAAANRCALSTNFSLRMPDASLDTVTLLRHRAGLVIPSVHDKRQALDALQQSMAGVVALVGRELRMRAGQMLTPSFALTTAWLVGKDDAKESCFFAQNTLPREERFNIVTGKCFDPDQRYQLLPYPAVQDSVLLAAQGERAGEVDMPAVSHIAHGQHLASIEIRRRQASGAFQALCDLQALLLEPLDVGTIDLPDWGIVAKTVEVEAWSFSVSEPIGLAMREITADIFTVDAELDGRDPAPDSTLRQPWEVAQLPSITVSSSTSAVDASLLVRTTVSWAAVTGSWIRNGGRIEIQYTRADEALPSGEWASQREPGDATSSLIVGLSAGRPYLFRGRMVQELPLVRGAWSPIVRAFIAAAPTAGSVELVPHGVVSSLLIAGGTIRKVSGSAAWDAGAYSKAAIVGACEASARVVAAGHGLMLALNSDPSTNASYDTLDHAIYQQTTISTQIYESGALVATFALTAAGDIYRIKYTGAAVEYWRNATMLRSVVVGMGKTFSLDSSLHSVGASLDLVQFRALSSKGVDFKVSSLGGSATGVPSGVDGYLRYVDDGNSAASAPARSYMMARINRSSGLVTFAQTYDVYGSAANAATLASDLNATGNDSVVVVWSNDEPQTNRLTNGLPDAMYRCGASRNVFGAPGFKYRSAYILIGIGGCGHANGFEAYRGDSDSATDAYVQAAFQVTQGGQLMVEGRAYTGLLGGVVGTTEIGSGAATGVSQNIAAGPFSITTGVGWTVPKPASPEAAITVSLDGNETAVIVAVEATHKWSHVFSSPGSANYQGQIAVRRASTDYGVRAVEFDIYGPTAATYTAQKQISTSWVFTGLAAGSHTFGFQWIEGSGGPSSDGNPFLSEIKTRVEIIKR